MALLPDVRTRVRFRLSLYCSSISFRAVPCRPSCAQAWIFNHIHPEKIPSAQERYKNEARRVLGVLESALSTREWLVGGKVTIADLIFCSWVLRFYLFYTILTLRAHLGGMCFCIMSLGQNSISSKSFLTYTSTSIYRTCRPIMKVHFTCRWQAKMLEIPGVKLGLQQKAAALAAGL